MKILLIAAHDICNGIFPLSIDFYDQTKQCTQIEIYEMKDT